MTTQQQPSPAPAPLDAKGREIRVGDIVWLAQLASRSAVLGARRVLAILPPPAASTYTYPRQAPRLRVQSVLGLRTGRWVWKNDGKTRPGIVSFPERCLIDMEERY